MGVRSDYPVDLGEDAPLDVDLFEHALLGVIRAFQGCRQALGNVDTAQGAIGIIDQLLRGKVGEIARDLRARPRRGTGFGVE